MTRASGARRELPPPLPPERRTVGQAVAETARLYGAHFVRALPLGLVVATVNQVTIGRSRPAVSLTLVLVAPLFSLAFAYAAQLASSATAKAGAWARAVLAGTLVFIPAAVVFPWFAIASVLWLAFLGLSVPVAMLEQGSILDSVRRGEQLARAGYVHVAGTFLTLAVVFFLTRAGLALVLESQADNTTRTAIFLADTVVSPLLFFGGVIAYVDVNARLRSRGSRRKERDADVPDALDADREGRADAAREPGPAA